MQIKDLILNDTTLPSKSILANGVCARVYKAEPPTDNWIVFIHGKGEAGPADGSMLNLVEKLPGFPRYAKGVRPGSSVSFGQYEFPFNILALQYESQTSGLASGIFRGFADWFVGRFNPRKWGVYGISMGSIYGQYQIWKWSEGSVNHPDFAVSVCGTHSFPSVLSKDAAGNYFPAEVIDQNRSAYAAAFPDIPALAYHGDADETVGYGSHKTFVDYYNKTHINKIGLTTIPGGDHAAGWNEAYKLPLESNALYKWTLAQFSEKTAYEIAAERVSSEIKNLRDLA
jgi:hypothetical protein